MVERLRERVQRAMEAAPLPHEGRFTSRLHSPAVAARIGVWLGVCFLLTFVTGWLSHEAQNPETWVPFPTQPAWLYQVTQGVHVVVGTASIPLLLLKLWTVYPKLFAPIPTRARRLLIVGIERASIAALVASSIFQVVTGVMNAAQWYPWEFSFRATHYALGWVAIGSLGIHIAVKLPVIRRALGADIDAVQDDHPAATRPSTLSRRGLVNSALLASGIAMLTTAGSTVPFLRRVSVFAVRSGEGPQGIPINRSARAAGVLETARADSYELTVVNGDTRRTFSRADLEELPQRTHDLPIACVEGWSATGSWSGVVLRDLLELVGAPMGRDVRVVSLQTRGSFGRTILPHQFVDEPQTLIALSLNGSELSIDHGFPCRLIAPNRPGVLQTKWITRLEVL